MARSLPETLTEAVRATVWERDQEAWNTPRPPVEPPARDEPRAVHLMRGRFEAHFEDVEAARAAARDARAVGFVVDVEQEGARWLAVGRRALAFPDDERARYASRLQAIATQHGGSFSGFVEEPHDAA